MSSCISRILDEKIPTPDIDTHTPSPIAISSSPTTTPTATPFVPFDGPKLIYLAYSGLEDKSAVFMVNASGTEKKKLNLPTDFDIQFLEKAISPDGKWMAFQTGTKENKDIALNLFSFDANESVLITFLLSPDYPNNFQKAFEQIQNSQKSFPNKDDISLSTLQMGFSLAIVSWSPDSRYLAFAGEMDGPTSDLYIYDTENKSTKRLVDDLLNISYISWAGDGKTIYFSNTVPGQNYSWSIDYNMNIKTAYIQELDIAGWGVTDFCFNSEFCLWHYQGDGGDPNSISLLDVSSGKSKTLWEPTFQDYAIAFRNELIVVSGPYADIPTPGTYFIDFAGKHQKISDIFFDRFIYWDAEKPCFIGAMPDGLYQILLNGDIRKIYDTAYYEFSISPDNKWLIVYNNSPYVESKGVLLINNKLEVVQTIGNEKIEKAVWLPDSTGLLFVTKDLHYISIPDGALKLIEKNTDLYLDEYQYGWIP
jgi:dipeptidyl aminopeptidase/acylaminoacyl peptidase